MTHQYSCQFSLCQADHEQYLQTLGLNQIEWGKKLTSEQYKQRELHLLSTSFAKNNHKCWILTPNGSNTILASCETYSRSCSLTKEDGSTITGKCWSIASVFTPPGHRKKGYASMLLSKLLSKCKEAGCIASTLYSDIGPYFYTKLGWKLFPASTSIINITDQKPIVDERLTNIDVTQVSDIFNQEKQPQISNSFQIAKTADAIEWLYRRGVYYQQTLTPDTIITSCGSLLNPNNYIMWYHDLPEKSLYVLTMISTTQANHDALLNASLFEAAKFGLKKVVIYDPNEFCIGKIEREGSLPQLAVLCDGIDVDKLVWLTNEKYAWV